MSEIGETFKIIKEERRKKKESNINYSTKLILSKGYDVAIKNGGVHLIVKHNGITVDFWPSTGKWCDRKTGVYSRGVNRLIKFLDKEKGK